MTSLKVTWNEGPDQALQGKENGLAPETMLRTQRSRPFLKSQKKFFFWHFSKEGTP